MLLCQRIQVTSFPSCWLASTGHRKSECHDWSCLHRRTEYLLCVAICTVL